ncbi:hypothetical protein VTO73DRAFT_6180 [Trametes versicolor]
MNASARLIAHFGAAHAGALGLLDGCVSTRAPPDGDLFSSEVSSINDSESSEEALPGMRVQS